MVVRRPRLAVLAAALVVVACDAPTIPEETFAYDPRLPGGLVYHWPIGAAISVYLDPAGWGQLQPRPAMLAAFEQWEEVVHYRDFDLRLADSPSNADVIVHSSEAPFLVDVSACIYPGGGGTGVTFFCPTEAGDEVEVLPLLSGASGRVKMDVAISAPPGPGTETLQAYFAHELGHVLGIGGHSDDPDDLLHASIAVTAPSEGDARTLRWVLRQPATLRP